MVAVMPDCYVHMVNKFFFPENCDIDLATIWFQQVGLIAHTAHQSVNTWRAVFERHISDIFWWTYLCDLSFCEFLYMGLCQKQNVLLPSDS